MNMSSMQDFSSKVPKDETLKKLDVLRFRPNIIGEHTPLLPSSRSFLLLV